MKKLIYAFKSVFYMAFGFQIKKFKSRFPRLYEKMISLPILVYSSFFVLTTLEYDRRPLFILIPTDWTGVGFPLTESVSAPRPAESRNFTQSTELSEHMIIVTNHSLRI